MRFVIALVMVVFAVNAQAGNMKTLMEQFDALEADYTVCVSQKSCKTVIDENIMNKLLADPQYTQAFAQCQQDTTCDARARELSLKMLKTLQFYK